MLLLGTGGTIASPYEMMLWDKALRGKKILGKNPETEAEIKLLDGREKGVHVSMENDAAPGLALF